MLRNNHKTSSHLSCYNGLNTHYLQNKMWWNLYHLTIFMWVLKWKSNDNNNMKISIKLIIIMVILQGMLAIRMPKLAKGFFGCTSKEMHIWNYSLYPMHSSCLPIPCFFKETNQGTICFIPNEVTKVAWRHRPSNSLVKSDGLQNTQCVTLLNRKSSHENP